MTLRNVYPAPMTHNRHGRGLDADNRNELSIETRSSPHHWRNRKSPIPTFSTLAPLILIQSTRFSDVPNVIIDQCTKGSNNGARNRAGDKVGVEGEKMGRKHE